MAAAATRLGRPSEAAAWESHRSAILAGMEKELTYTDQVDTAGVEVYAELRGCVLSFSGGARE